MANSEKILITGFSGSGKTSFLRAMEEISPAGWETFDDLDQLILKDLRGKFPTLEKYIESVGWDAFRLKERQLFEGWIKEEGKGVLALGGGTLSPLLLELYGKNKKLVWVHLDADFKTCFARLVKSEEAEPRPLLKLGEMALEKIYQDRKKVFEQLPYTIKNSDHADLEDLARNFWQLILAR